MEFKTVLITWLFVYGLELELRSFVSNTMKYMPLVIYKSNYRHIAQCCFSPMFFRDYSGSLINKKSTRLKEYIYIVIYPI